MKTQIKSFDYQSYADKYNLKSDEIKRITEEVREEFPDDEMMAELHIIRAINRYRRNRKE